MLKACLGHVELQLDTQRQLNQVCVCVHVLPVENYSATRGRPISLQAIDIVLSTHPPTQSNRT